MHVRLITAIEMISNQDDYDVSSSTYMYAISAAFKVSIQSYIPPTAALGFQLSPYTVTVMGRDVPKDSDVHVHLMWTALAVPRGDEPFQLNHFAILHQVIEESVNTSDCDIRVS